jgi:hypothetical protein
MEITDKDRLDFIENNILNVSYDIDSEDIPYWRINHGLEGYCLSEGNKLRKTIDNAIMAMQEKDK